MARRRKAPYLAIMLGGAVAEAALMVLAIADQDIGLTALTGVCLGLAIGLFLAILSD